MNQIQRPNIEKCKIKLAWILTMTLVKTQANFSFPISQLSNMHGFSRNPAIKTF